MVKKIREFKVEMSSYATVNTRNGVMVRCDLLKCTKVEITNELAP